MKKLLCIILAVLLTASFTACKNTDNKSDNSSSAPTSQTASTNESSESVSVQQNTLFKKGVWGVEGEGKAIALYDFTEDGKDCKHYTTDDSATVIFDYEPTGSNNDYIFHMKTFGSDAGASVVFLDQTHAAIIWETLEQEKLAFITDKPFDEYLKSVDVNNIELK